MKHAFLIIAHGKWEQLCTLISQIDAHNHDIYIHIDAKSKNIPTKKILSAAKKSKVKTFSEFKVYWGSFELLEVEIFLMEQAKKEQYDYYHLLSGMDLLIKSNKYIDAFFLKNKGKEFVHFDTEERLIKDKEIQRRTKCYHLFTNYRKRFKHKLINKFFDFLEHISLALQTIIGIDRTKKYNFQIKYGSQWFSITHELVKYIVSQKKTIYQIFKKTKCSDELFIQTIVYNSKFKNKLYNKKYDNDINANMRLLDINIRGKDGSPYTWRNTDFDEIKESQCIFARKFDSDKDYEIIKKVINMTSKE